jgi:capsular exopolysaccharide synthesis family protein
MLQKVKEAGITSAARATNVELLSAAATPESPAKPSLPLYGAVGLGMGFVLGMILAVAQGSGDRRIAAPGEGDSHMAYPDLGAVPYAYGGRGEWLTLGDSRQLGSGEDAGRDNRESQDSALSPELASWVDSHSPMAESVRAALAGVLFAASPGQEPRVLAVTSASDGEGKTTVACNFALTLARMNQRVLLIDGHLRKPRLHDVFGFPNRQGFGDLLERLGSDANRGAGDSCAPVDMAALGMAGLQVLPAGERGGGLTARHYSPELPRLLESWRKEYDFIVIDTAPVSLLDSRPLARAADGVVLVVEARRTSQDAVQACLRRLENDGANVLGTVVNDRDAGRMQVRTPPALPAAPLRDSYQPV